MKLEYTAFGPEKQQEHPFGALSLRLKLLVAQGIYGIRTSSPDGGVDAGQQSYPNRNVESIRPPVKLNKFMRICAVLCRAENVLPKC
jgi:hypothetical protein